MVRSKLCGCRHHCEDSEILFFNDRCFNGDQESIAVSLATASPEFNPTNVSLCLSSKHSSQVVHPGKDGQLANS